jgi:hypothetical protein
MTVIYVCLNEAPHYEVRNPAIGAALTQLWMEVDARTIDPKAFEDAQQLVTFLNQKLDQICLEVDAMAELSRGHTRAPELSRRQLAGTARRRGKIYTEAGWVQEETTLI